MKRFKEWLIEAVKKYSYLEIGHDSSGIVWWYDHNKNKLNIIEGGHRGKSDDYWSGRYDPIKKAISIVPPDLGNQRIPPSLKIELSKKFGYGNLFIEYDIV